MKYYNILHLQRSGEIPNKLNELSPSSSFIYFRMIVSMLYVLNQQVANQLQIHAMLVRTSEV
jgi:hypothetical protein